MIAFDRLLLPLMKALVNLRDSRDCKQKQRIGDFWARRSAGLCKFLWVENYNWQAIKDAVK